jgi:Fe-S-cluster-containing dehydrogenase component
MKKWNLIIDVERCHDCNNCFLSCKDEHFDNDFPPYSLAQPRHGQRWIDIQRKERGQYPKVDVAYLPLPCMHCDDADCIKAAENDAIYKRDDGIVIIDPVKAKGQRAVVDACPYGVIYWNEALDLPQKCTLCAHLLDEGWTQPRCVQACPTGAMRFVSAEDAEMQEIIQAEGLEFWHAEYGLEPRVYYKHLYRFNKHFIAGNVVLKGSDECAEGAQVTLRNGSGETIATAVTNNYGDFKLDNLEGEHHPYKLEVTYPGYPTQGLQLELENSLNVGAIFL